MFEIESDGLRLVFVFLAFLFLASRVYKLLTKHRHRYIGQRDKQKRRHGKGTQYLSNGDKFEGEFCKDQYKVGTYTFKKGGGSYVGPFQNGRFHGVGVEVYSEGGKYEGGFQNGLRHGQGFLAFKSGNSYKGTWKDGKKHGKGVHKSAVGTYTGEFVNGKREGKGVMVFSSGHFAKYQGRWRGGVFSGKGKVWFRENGGRWEGMFEKGTPHGEGVFIASNGKRAIHVYDYGKVKSVIVDDKDKNKSAQARPSPGDELGAGLVDEKHI
mmetsp:Transcript_15924/g.39265  ORF Transcript_15924/g.39265 Transcript_15924/m.39265 type:complete len:267 (+) Transcript_15924:265-1065(+)|eukprot:CAMPEP_0114514070 /NCGR_PEP_ID=MMETSP0109-20121206/15943_1 /TAXON_ID=29199 /ORGANISM="Chlorarachnion reptans, Strain CCCM449" /LENGTH=266 /DNA_ID=CAMNT_0001694057 /DNA_START=191 /DNA_END=991 /DNA_ORIENTATION=-